MPMFNLPPVRPRLSWGKNSTTSKDDSTTKKRKRTVRFSRQQPEMIDSEYEMTESLQKALWYRKKDLMAIRMKLDHTVRQAVMGCNDGHCTRGLETLIADSISPSQSRHLRYERFARGVLSLQQWQRVQGTTVSKPEVLRRYCLQAGSKQQQSYAWMRGKQDAMAALKHHERFFLVDMDDINKHVSKARASPDEVFPRARIPNRLCLSRQTSTSRAA